MEFVAKNMRENQEHYLVEFKRTYSSPSIPPIWMVMEFLTLGNLSNLYENMKDCEVKKAIATRWKLPSVILISWLKSLNFVRNCCAHHARLWNRRLPLKPTLPRRDKYRFLNHIDDESDKQLFGILSCMLYLLEAIGQDAELRHGIKRLFAKYPEINRRYMGFHPNWGDEPLWK
jgi:abortive infection bacteriophage resistance protein